MKRSFLHIVWVILIIPLFQGCSTEKNTLASRTYHKVTSKYNIHFNAHESFKAGQEKIETGIEDDFTRNLPIYKISNPTAAGMVKSDMDNAIIKSSKLIEIHSITAKPKRRRQRTQRYQEFASKNEFNPWIDRSYLLIGKSYFYQHNFLSAIENFSYILRMYPMGDARHEAQIWLIRSYAELERFAEASEVIQAVQNDKDFPRKLERELAIAIADYYVKREAYTDAIRFLDIALNRTFWKKQKARLQYIVAQLYEITGNNQEAAEAYLQVTRLNPDYRMAFNAKIKAAGVLSGSGDLSATKKELQKMLRDKKNVEFLDQIYFALGKLSMQEGDLPQAIEYYRLSVARSYNNTFQRAQSAITLADIYFDQRNYRESQAYYDSAMIIIDNTYPDYENLSTQYQSLTNLIDHVLTVEREDSLQRVAQMPEVQREQLIARLMQEEQERQRSMEGMNMQGQSDQGYYRSNRYRMGMGSGQQSTGWYFYNPQTVAYGQVTFQQQWGQRKLEDNWRRSNKNIVSEDEMDDSEMQADSSQMVVRIEDPMQKEFYLQDLPMTDSLMTISHHKIRDALYNTGKIYKSDFSDYARSAESFEELLRRYPENIYQVSAYFDLYNLYLLIEDTQKANEYKNIIISQFPESKFAQYLSNPNFFVEMQTRTENLNRIYEKAFKGYRAGNYREVINLIDSLKAMKPDSLMLPKMEFMETVAQGTQTDIHQFETLLEAYINRWPSAEPSPLANEILTLIQDSTLADYQKLVDLGYINAEIENEEVLTNRGEDDEFGGKFSYDDDLLHYFVIAHPKNAEIDMNRLKFDIANYNIDHYTKFDFDIETESLNENTSLVTVRALGNKEEGIIYHRAIIRKAPVFQTLNGLEYVNFSISSTNYRQILTEGSIADYLKFFVKNYSRHIGPDFQEEETDISPEELMARARNEESLLREKGEFRVVETGASALYTNAIDTAQNFVLAVKDLSLSMRQSLSGFAQFNREEFSAWNLSTKQMQTGDYQLIMVQGIPSLNEAMSYFRTVVITRNLFESLGQATYRNFLITDANFDKLINDADIEDYIDFFRKYYIQRTPAQPQPTTDTQGHSPETPREEPTAPEEPPQTEISYNGPYSILLEQPHYFVFVIPSEGVDRKSFVSGIEQFNQNAGPELSVREETIDEFRTAIIISGLTNRDAADRYSRTIVQNRALYEPLGAANYRNFLISEENFGIFLQEKNINDYMEFYKQIYLEE